MTDRELLELAAKAAGITWTRYDACPSGVKLISGWGLVVAATFDALDGGSVIRWNPLIDDGDALRLAVKLRIDVEFMMARALAKGVASWEAPQREAIEELASEECAAVRRAIVRVAAKIGADIDEPQSAG